jgi:glucose/arabinose dehydrogenase
MRRPSYRWPPGDPRLFVVLKRGRVRIVRNGAIAMGDFLDIRDQVLNAGEQGFLGMAFHPAFARNGRFYVHYSHDDNGDGIGDGEIVEYTVSAANPDAADPASRRPILSVEQPAGRDNHKGGMIAFGPDGFLYIGLGDGGAGGDPDRNGQNINVLLGKILRIDVDSVSAGRNYGIPPGNLAGGLPEIYHYGVRNPWRFSFDRITNLLYLGDVGQDIVEEVDVVPAATGGLNFGWRIMEGDQCYPPGSSCDASGKVPPAKVYRHPNTTRCSITGGYAYRGCRMPGWHGTYFYADYCSGEVGWFQFSGGVATQDQELNISMGDIGSPSSFGEDGLGEIYITDIGGGRLFRLEPR